MTAQLFLQETLCSDGLVGCIHTDALTYGKISTEVFKFGVASRLQTAVECAMRKIRPQAQFMLLRHGDAGATQPAKSSTGTLHRGLTYAFKQVGVVKNGHKKCHQFVTECPGRPHPLKTVKVSVALMPHSMQYRPPY